LLQGYTIAEASRRRGEGEEEALEARLVAMVIRIFLCPVARLSRGRGNDRQLEIGAAEYSSSVHLISSSGCRIPFLSGLGGRTLRWKHFLVISHKSIVS
jgi:hypothetical protein